MNATHGLLLVLLFAGCQSSPTLPATTAEPSATEPSAAEAAPAEIALDGEGLRFVLLPSGSTRPLPFRTDSAQVMRAVARLRGAPSERGTNAECGAGPLGYATWPGGLTLYFSNAQFAGWTVTDQQAGRAPRLTTMSGLGLGSTRTDLLQAYAAHVQATTLGTEFLAGGLSGILSGPGSGATIVALWAGAPCAFR